MLRPQLAIATLFAVLLTGIGSASAQCISAWPEASLAGICNLTLGGQAASSPGCTIYRECTGSSSSRPFAQICNVTKIFSSLCLDVPTAIPECATAQSIVEKSGGNFTSCLQASAFSIYSTSAVISDILQMCSEMGDASNNWGGMGGCSLCPTASQCPDPLATLGIACLNMTMMSCNNHWAPFCSGDALVPGAPRGGVGYADQTLCLRPGQYTPPPPSPLLGGGDPCLTDPSSSSCASYSYPDADATADIGALCGFDTTQLPACGVWSSCQAGNLTGTACQPFTVLATLCSNSTGSPSAMACRAYAALCDTTGTQVQQCAAEPPLTFPLSPTGVVPAAAPSPSTSPAASPPGRLLLSSPPPPTTQTPSANQGSGSTTSCLVDPSQDACTGYQYSDALAESDITSLCLSMPTMPGCSVWNTCQGGQGASGLFCAPFMVLATLCHDMPTMSGCSTYNQLCSNTSKVQQCTQQPGIPDAVSSNDALQQVSTMCSEMTMPQCDLCQPPFTTSSCPDPLYALSAMCISMPSMVQCAAYFNMCAAAAAMAQSANAASGTSTSGSLSRYCTNDFSAASSSPDGSFTLPSVDYLPTMLMYFHQRVQDVVLWKEWLPHNSGQYAATIICVVLFGVVSVGLKSFKSGLTMWWSHQETQEAAAQQLQAAQAAAAAAAKAGMGAGLMFDQFKGTEGVSFRVLTAKEERLAGPYWWLSTQRQLWENLIKSSILGISLTLDYFNMLVAMTFNIGLFVAVIGGYILGSLLFTHVLDNFSARLRLLKHREAALHQSSRPDQESSGFLNGSTSSDDAELGKVGRLSAIEQERHIDEDMAMCPAC